MLQKSRREFLCLVAYTSGIAPNRKYLIFNETLKRAADGLRITSPFHRYSQLDPPHWEPAPVNAVDTIIVDARRKYQTMLGFGAALTDSSCYLLSTLSRAQRRNILLDLFSDDGLRFSVGRICIGASDYSRSLFTYDDSSEPDPDLRYFSIDHDRSYILPILREIRQIQPSLFLLATPWSPPAWMKSGKSMLGGSMRKKYFAEYAQYFNRFIQSYREEGIPVDAVTVQNEPDTDQDGSMPATLWGQEYEIDFIKNHLGPVFKESALGTKIWLLDHNYNLWGRVLDELSVTDMARFVDGVAWHNYGGNPSAMSRVHAAYPEIGNYWTEGGGDITDPNYLTDWAKWSHTFTEILRNWSKCIIGWNLALDERGLPKVGPFACGGLITINSHTQTVTKSGQYWAFAHYAKSMQRGCHIISSEGTIKDVDHVAFENPDGTRGIILTNGGESRSVWCRVGQNVAKIDLTANSLMTIFI